MEERTSGKIVSSLNLISQTWSYAGIEFGVGRPELVGTLPEYRHRGLVRLQFEVIHQWSAERGELLQAITGIPYYYRQFGYEMAVNLGGGRVGYQPQLPKLPDGQAEPYTIRPATIADLPFLAQVYAQAQNRYLLSCVRDEKMWQHELDGKSEQNVNRQELRIIEAPDGEMLGFFGHPVTTWGPTMMTNIYELKSGANWGAVTPVVARFLYSTGKTYATRDGKGDDFNAFGFWLGAEHPAYQVMIDRLARVRPPYAWYLRLADLPGFLRHITPALEKRLANSPYAGFHGEIKLSFYRSGLHLEFEHGRLAQIEHWPPTPLGHSGDAAFPNLTFLQLLFGYRSLEELRYAFPDCVARGDDANGLLNALFPKQSSDIWPVS